MYLPALQGIPYFNRNETILPQFYMIESLYDCYHVARFSTFLLGFYQLRSDHVEGNFRDKQTKILQNELGFQPAADRITEFFY